MEERNGSECDDQSIQGVKENLHGASLIQLVQIRRNLHVMKKTCFFFKEWKKNIYIAPYWKKVSALTKIKLQKYIDLIFFEGYWSY